MRIQHFHHQIPGITAHNQNVHTAKGRRDKSAQVARIANQILHTIKGVSKTEEPKAKVYSDRYYSEYVPFDQVVELGLENRRGEAHVPLINLTKKELGIDIESEVLSDFKGLMRSLFPEKSERQREALLARAKKQCRHKAPDSLLKWMIKWDIRSKRQRYEKAGKSVEQLLTKPHVSREEAFELVKQASRLVDQKAAQEVFSSFLGQDVQAMSPSEFARAANKIRSGKRWVLCAKQLLKRFDKRPSRDVKAYFNTVNDAYGKGVLDTYLNSPENKNKLSQALQEWTAKRVAKGIVDDTFRENRQPPEMCNDFQQTLVRCLMQKDGPHFKEHLEACLNHQALKDPQVQRRMTERLLSHYQGGKIKKVLSHKTLQDPAVVDMVKRRMNNHMMEALKEAQAKEIYRYDGLIEHYAPATIRGLHDVDDQVVKQLATEGDYASAYDIFNHEVSSGARRSLYARGHTGPSNRSTTLNFNIASYFATSHGMSSGTPENVWFMIYEPQNALYMPNVEAAGAWRESEVVMPHLGAKHFLGAVKYQVDHSQTNKEKIVLKPVDGFLSDKAKKGEFDGTGIVGELKQVFDTAKNFTTGNTAHLSPLSVDRRPEKPKTWMSTAKKIAGWKGIDAFKRKISQVPNRFVGSVLPKKAMPTGRLEYLTERAKQRAFVERESDFETLERLEREKQKNQELFANFWKERSVTSLPT